MALIELFNKSPIEGVEELLRCEGVDSNQLPPAGAPQVLRFLREAATGLNAERVGDWLCGDGQLNAQVLQALLTDVCVAGLSLDGALQLSVADILLPGNLGGKKIGDWKNKREKKGGGKWEIQNQFFDVLSLQVL